MEPSLNDTALPTAAKNGKSSVVLVMSDRTFISRKFVSASALTAEDSKYSSPYLKLNAGIWVLSTVVPPQNHTD